MMYDKYQCRWHVQNQIAGLQLKLASHRESHYISFIQGGKMKYLVIGLKVKTRWNENLRIYQLNHKNLKEVVYLCGLKTMAQNYKLW